MRLLGFIIKDLLILIDLKIDNVGRWVLGTGCWVLEYKLKIKKINQ